MSLFSLIHDINNKSNVPKLSMLNQISTIAHPRHLSLKQIYVSSSIRIFNLYTNQFKVTWICIILILYSLIINLSNASTFICDASTKDIDLTLCPNQNIICDPEEDCTITCSSTDACSSKIIHCPINHRCELHCTNHTQDRQCHKITIHAESSSFLLVNATLGPLSHRGANTMDNSNIYCPQNGPFTSPQDIACHIFCDGDDIMQQSQVYAVEGFNDVIINGTAHDEKWCWRAGRMWCTQDLTTNCPMTSELNPPFRCNPGTASDFTCDTHTVTYSPTTSIPTTYAPTTTQPSITPSNSPTHTPSNTPSLSPTSKPTIVPSINPSKTPTNVPTSTPTLQPTEPTITSPPVSPTITDIPTSHPTIMPTIFIPPTTSTVPPISPTMTKQPSLNPRPTMVAPTISPIIKTTTTEQAALVIPVDRTPNMGIALVVIFSVSGLALCGVMLWCFIRFEREERKKQGKKQWNGNDHLGTYHHTDNSEEGIDIELTNDNDQRSNYNKNPTNTHNKDGLIAKNGLHDHSDYYSDDMDEAGVHRKGTLPDSFDTYLPRSFESFDGKRGETGKSGASNEMVWDHRMKTKDEKYMKHIIEQKEKEDRRRDEMRRMKKRDSEADSLFGKTLGDFSKKHAQVFDEEVLNKMANDEDPILSTDCEYSMTEEQKANEDKNQNAKVVSSPTTSKKKSFLNIVRNRSKSRSTSKRGIGKSRTPPKPQFEKIESMSQNGYSGDYNFDLDS